MDARLNDAAGLIACAQLIASGKFTATSSELFHLVGDALDALYEDFFSK